MQTDRRLALLLSALAFFVAAFLSTVLAGAGPSWVALLFDEHSPVAWLTSVLLAMAAISSGAAAVSAARPAALTALAVLCLGASLDEWFMGHERLKERLLFGTFAGDLEAMGSLGDLPLVFGGLVMLGVLFPLFREPPHPWMRGLLSAFVALSCAALSLDLFAPIDPWHAVEEVMEAVAAALLLAAALCAGAQVHARAER